MMKEQTAPLFFPTWLMRMSQLFSVLFHPLFIGVLMAAYLLFIHPTYFIGYSERAKLMKLLIVINNNLFFPMIV
ncbi:MAG: hypothetical protein EBU73_09250, partial [Chitinophagia bacterium]|nr:hypothetical protein [Chitinophagia bacterium]